VRVGPGGGGGVGVGGGRGGGAVIVFCGVCFGVGGVGGGTTVVVGGEGGWIANCRQKKSAISRVKLATSKKSRDGEKPGQNSKENRERGGGGISVFHGHSVSRSDMWFDQLQREVGNRFKARRGNLILGGFFCGTRNRRKKEKRRKKR